MAAQDYNREDTEYVWPLPPAARFSFAPEPPPWTDVTDARLTDAETRLEQLEATVEESRAAAAQLRGTIDTLARLVHRLLNAQPGRELPGLEIPTGEEA